eukprot:4823378-Prymnesium_polylepis.2
MRVALALAFSAHRVVKVGHELAPKPADVDDMLQEADDLLILARSARTVEHGLDPLPHPQRLVTRHPYDAQAWVAASP